MTMHPDPSVIVLLVMVLGLLVWLPFVGRDVKR